MRPFFPNRLRPFLLILAAGACALTAQQVREQPPLYPGPFSIVPGVFVTPVPGLPFTATVIIESKVALEDGTTQTRLSQALIARDTNGRIRNERHALVPEGSQGMPPLLSVHVFDPTTRISTVMNPFTHIAQQRVIPLPVNHAAGPNAVAEDLGTTTLNGMPTHGTRIIHTIRGRSSGTGKPVTITDEFWYSDELHMNLLETHTDVRGGTQTVSILSIQREEPSPTLFEIPAGYKVVDLTPPPDSPAAQVAPR